METRIIEIKDFVITHNGAFYQLKAQNVNEYIFLKIEQIIEILKIENIEIDIFDKKIDQFEEVSFKKVILFVEQYLDNSKYLFNYAKLYESWDTECEGVNFIGLEDIKAL